MLNYLINHSIDKNKIIIENQSTTTEENNINILNMLGLNKVNKELNIGVDIPRTTFITYNVTLGKNYEK